MSNLGKLEKVDLRQAWMSEAGDFTPWLAREENIARLSEEILIELEVEAQEKNVGPFRADILCKNTLTNNWVLIENQLERTDHIHLGQLLTYAAGLDAVTIVWIAERFRDEHRAAIDWLNRITDGDFNFFGLEIELWRIGDSPLAPKFNLVCQPNDWSKQFKASAKNLEEVTPTKQLQLEYWERFHEQLRSGGSHLKPNKPQPSAFSGFAIGRSHFWLEAVANIRDQRIAVALIVEGGDSEAHFSLLLQEREAMENEIGHRLDWPEDSNSIRKRITLARPNSDPERRDQWDMQHQWLQEKLETFHRVFGPRVKRLDAAEYLSDEGEG